MAPRLKPLKDEKQIAAIPVSEPVLVEIAPTPSGLEQPNAEIREPPTPEVQTEDDGAAKLKKELDALKSAGKLNEEAVARERKRAEDAERLARQREQELAAERTHREQAVNDNITSALAGAQAEQAAAEGEYAAAYKAEDPDAMAKAQGKIARAAAKALNYEAAAAELADRKTQQPQQQYQPQQQQAPVDIVTAVNSNPGLLQPEKEWLLKHQDVLVDRARGVELEAAYIRATRAGHHRGTDAYFQFLDRELGYSANGQQAQTTEEDNDNNSGTNVMAPVTRDNVSPSNGQNDSSRQVTLTPEQREFARSMGLTDVAYAQQVLRLRQEKKQNPDKFRG